MKRSLGCLVLEMLTGQQPWFGVKGNIMLLLANGQGPPIPTEGLSEAARNFLVLCFSVYESIISSKVIVSDPDTRPTALYLLTHSFVATMDSNFDFDVWMKSVTAKRAIILAERRANDGSSTDDTSDYDSHSDQSLSRNSNEDDEIESGEKSSVEEEEEEEAVDEYEEKRE